MQSTSLIDFSVRRNKAIERQRAFRSLRMAYDKIECPPPIYVGFGSVWFTDFVLAHRELGIDDLFSIEADEIVARRAQFNKPYRTVEVLGGHSTKVLPELLARQELITRPWVVWLDYDDALAEQQVEELTELVAALPDDSALLTTFSGDNRKFGGPTSWRTRLSTLFGDAIDPSDVPDTNLGAPLPLLLALCGGLQNALKAHGLQLGREYIPAIHLPYRDGSPMGTVGGFLPSSRNIEATRAAVASSSWPGIVKEAIATTPLTLREVTALQSLMPVLDGVSRADVNALGFDLDQADIDSYVRNYKEFPVFSQMATS